VGKAQASHKMSRISFLGLMDSLEGTTHQLRWKPSGTEWGNYYVASASDYTPSAFEHKKQVVSKFLERIQPTGDWDLGANKGEYS